MNHERARCENTNGWYRQRGGASVGYWIEEYTCPVCRRKGNFHRNWLGRRWVICDGLRFLRLTHEQVGIGGNA